MATLLAVAAASALASASPATAAHVPAGFVGANADGPITKDLQLFGDQMNPMVAAGVETVRFNFDWRRIQPYKSESDVPSGWEAFYPKVDGRPTDFRATDEKVGDAAKAGLTVQPVLMYAPNWAARHPGIESSPPKDFKAYAQFASTMVERYGTNGTFWTDHATDPSILYKPITNWQIWNEPHFKEFWKDKPWSGDYVKMLKKAASAIRGTDSSAKVVLAGLANKSWNYLARIYEHGARNHFDIVAIHPFTKKPKGVITILEYVRKVMRENKDSHKPLEVTELSWTSAKGKTSRHFGIEESESGQAKKLRQAFQLLAKNRKRLRLRAAYWYDWISRDESKVDPFDYAGVMTVQNGNSVKKPAYKALRKTARELEG